MSDIMYSVDNVAIELETKDMQRTSIVNITSSSVSEDVMLAKEQINCTGLNQKSIQENERKLQ